MKAIATTRYSNTPCIVGITGGIGSGKSFARKMFEALNVPCIDADQVARNIHQDPAHPATQLIAKSFPTLLADNGALERGSLHRVFAINTKANSQLKSILKPFVIESMRRWTERQSAPYVVWESALLLEEKVAVDRVLVVDASEECRIARIQLRNPDWNMHQIQNILAMQISRQAFLEQMQDVIKNDASPAELQQQVEAMHWHYLKQWG